MYSEFRTFQETRFNPSTVIPMGKWSEGNCHFSCSSPTYWVLGTPTCCRERPFSDCARCREEPTEEKIFPIGERGVIEKAVPMKRQVAIFIILFSIQINF